VGLAFENFCQMYGFAVVDAREILKSHVAAEFTMEDEYGAYL